MSSKMQNAWKKNIFIYYNDDDSEGTATSTTIPITTILSLVFTRYGKHFSSLFPTYNAVYLGTRPSSVYPLHISACLVIHRPGVKHKTALFFTYSPENDSSLESKKIKCYDNSLGIFQSVYNDNEILNRYSNEEVIPK